MKNKKEQMTALMQMCQLYFDKNLIFRANEINKALSLITDQITTSKKIRSEIEYIDMPMSFDIETTSIYTKDGLKMAFMYVWQFSIMGIVVMGRTWDGFTEMMETMSEHFNTDIKKRLVIYIHNLSYEFQFLYKYFDWESVFVVGSRKPAYALTKNGIEFRCSYILSGYSLAKVGEQLNVFKCNKMVGDLDYDKIRHSETELTEKEIGYCVGDVQTVVAYIAERIIEDGGIAYIPLTNTGYVRQYTRKKCMKTYGYRKMISKLTIDPDEYIQLKRAFSGGFTHANLNYSNEIMYNVTSYDFTSSYPTVMIAEKFPMSKGKKVKVNSLKEFYDYLKTYCCIFDIELTNVSLKDNMPDSPISASHCFLKEGITVDNGRIYKADRIRLTITDVDFQIYKAFYNFDEHFKIANFRIYRKGYLPKPIIETVLELYGKKTKLKDVIGMEVEYQHSKGMLNSLFGMVVIDPIQEHGEFNTIKGRWNNKEENEESKEDVCDVIDEYNKNKGRFLFYPWGVYITAYARRNLFSGILESKSDYIYSDTDSIKIINAENHNDYIRSYNTKVIEKLKKCLDFYKLDYELLEPETIKGKKKPLGVWDFDGFYTRFKTLGAKRYMTEQDENVKITVSGLNKTNAVNFLCKDWALDVKTHKEINSPFEKFSDDLYVPAEFTGKKTHTYIDEERAEYVTDYTGKKKLVHSISGVHLEGAEYNLNIEKYLSFILSIKGGA